MIPPSKITLSLNNVKILRPLVTKCNKCDSRTFVNFDADNFKFQELKREVNNVIEKKRKLEQELGRLKQHLVSIEESSTQDALANEDRERELRKKLQVCCQGLRSRP